MFKQSIKGEMMFENNVVDKILGKPKFDIDMTRPFGKNRMGGLGGERLGGAGLGPCGLGSMDGMRMRSRFDSNAMISKITQIMDKLPDVKKAEGDINIQLSNGDTVKLQLRYFENS